MSTEQSEAIVNTVNAMGKHIVQRNRLIGELVEALDEVAAVAELLRHQSGRDVNAFPEIPKARALLQQIQEGK